MMLNHQGGLLWAFTYYLAQTRTSLLIEVEFANNILHVIFLTLNIKPWLNQMSLALGIPRAITGLVAF